MRIRVGACALASALALCAGCAVALGDDASAGANGINSRGLGVNGLGVYIGQVETNYTGRHGVDKPGEYFWDYGPDGLPGTGDVGEGDGIRQPVESWVDNSGDGAYQNDWRNAHPDVLPLVQLNLNAAPGSAAPLLTGAIPPGPWNRLPADPNTGHHAIRVAGVMNALGATNKGVAPDALLVSAAYNNGTTSDPVLATQAVATARPVRVINHSYGFQNAGAYNGNSQITMGMDWIASRYNVLNVVAGDQTTSLNPGNPSDNYNGINVATSRTDGTGQFNTVDASNVFTAAAGGRNVVSFIAPGKDINVPIGPNGRTDAYAPRTGTSYAAPHATGTVALLQEYGVGRGNAPGWDSSRLDHRVFKAALINSCDKIKDDGTRTLQQGYLLGMERTVKDSAGLEWFDSEAFTNDAIPLDNEFGAGHLNASRALKQYQYGETQLGMPLQYIGWANTTIGQGGSQYYYFQNDLVLGSFISLTLCWDRVVGITNNAGDAETYDLTDTFSNTGLADLNLFLEFQYGDGSWGQERQSISTVDSTEHIFKRINMTGKYRIKVDFAGGLNQNTNYALAWWAIPSPGATGVMAIGAIFAGLRRRR